MRFVLHRHFTENDHFDLMIDDGGPLTTWRLNPEFRDNLRASGQASCERITDHRRDYLEYEGPTKSGSGRVEKHDSGKCIISGSEEDGLYCEFEGTILKGAYLIKGGYISLIK